jgi:hypothetical protein
MQKIISLCLILPALLLAGCAQVKLGAAHGDLPTQYPATVEDWSSKTINRAEFLKPYQLNMYQSVAVLPGHTGLVENAFQKKLQMFT